MNMFANLSRDSGEVAEDRVGGGFAPLDSGVYTGTVKMAYAGKSKAGAHSITAVIDLGGREYRETFYITNKEGKNTYTTQKDPNTPKVMQGYVMADDLCLLTTGLPLKQQAMEDKVVNIYDYEAKREVPTNVPMLVDLIGKPITAGILRQKVDKNAEGSDGKWHPTGETREQNAVDKFFHAESGRTVQEFEKGITEAKFLEKWRDARTGKIDDRSTGGDGKAGVPGQKLSAAFQPASAAKPATSLFNKA